jgi:hypothetical protein
VRWPPELVSEVVDEGDDELVGAAERTVELGAVGERRERASELAVGEAVEVPLASEARESAQQGEREHFGRGEGRIGSGPP